MEMAVGVICSSVPHLPPLFRHHKIQVSKVGHWLSGLLSSHKMRLKDSSDLPLNEIPSSNPKTPESQRMKVETRVLGSIQGYVLDLTPYS